MHSTSTACLVCEELYSGRSITFGREGCCIFDGLLLYRPPVFSFRYHIHARSSISSDMHMFFLATAFLLLFACRIQGLRPGRENDSERGALDFFSTIKPVYYKLTEGDLLNCHDVAPACYACLDNCDFNLNSWEITKRRQRVEYLKQIEACHEDYLALKAGLPEWCMNDGHDFFPVPGYVPTDEQCRLMSKVSCTTKWLSDLEKERRSGTRSKTNAAFKTAKKAQEHANIMESLAYYEKELAELPSKIQKYKEEREQNLLSEAYKHLEDPSEKETVFSHPIYIDMDKTISENRRLDLYISRNDIYMASLENKFVRRETVNQIPAFLNAISSLENHIQSKKSDTDAYIEDIKDISERTAVLQEKATNLIYETTHAKDVDGAIELLDKELFELYTALRQERSVLGDANVKSTFAKLRLIGMLRRLVIEISEQQQRMGCEPAGIMSP